MTIAIGQTITKADIVAQFNTRVRDWVTANTSWVSSTAVWNTTVGAVTANSVAYGGTINRTTQTTAAPAGPTVTQLNATIKANTAADSIVQVLKSFMVEYAKSMKVTLTNTGNLAPASYTGVIRTTTANAAASNLVSTDVDAAATSNQMTGNTLVTAAKVNGFIESCRTIWTNRMNTGVIEDYRYSYCHSSCHTNYTCYSSRGRR
jgi:hypothetical protein